MDHEFWLDKWNKKEIGFHQEDCNPLMISFFNSLDLKEKRIFVPLCGKSKDMLYFMQKGAHVLGFEVSEIAVEEFFTENALQFSVEQVENFKVYRSLNCTLYCGDIFEYESLNLKAFDYIYDRASLIALPTELRLKLINLHVCEIKKGACMFIITLSYNEDIAGKSGPPFSINEDMINNYYKGLKLKKHLKESITIEGKTNSFNHSFEISS